MEFIIYTINSGPSQGCRTLSPPPVKKSRQNEIQLVNFQIS